MAKRSMGALPLLLFVYSSLCVDASAQDAQALVEAAVNYYRWKTSVSVVDIIILVQLNSNRKFWIWQDLKPEGSPGFTEPAALLGARLTKVRLRSLCLASLANLEIAQFRS